MGSISHHITPLVIHRLGCGHTHINIQTLADRSNYKKPGMCQPVARARLVLKIESIVRLKFKTSYTVCKMEPILEIKIKLILRPSS